MTVYNTSVRWPSNTIVQQQWEKKNLVSFVGLHSVLYPHNMLRLVSLTTIYGKPCLTTLCVDYDYQSHPCFQVSLHTWCSLVEKAEGLQGVSRGFVAWLGACNIENSLFVFCTMIKTYLPGRISTAGA